VPASIGQNPVDTNGPESVVEVGVSLAPLE
jgi:hypothetical protein